MGDSDLDMFPFSSSSLIIFCNSSFSFGASQYARAGGGAGPFNSIFKSHLLGSGDCFFEDSSNNEKNFAYCVGISCCGNSSVAFNILICSFIPVEPHPWVPRSVFGNSLVVFSILGILTGTINSWAILSPGLIFHGLFPLLTQRTDTSPR